MIITDPPYNIGLDYGVCKDKLGKAIFIERCKTWLAECARILEKKGSMYLISYPEINAYLMPFLDDVLKLKFRRWLTWHYPTNIGHSPRNFTRTQRSILYYTKSNNYVFNKQEIMQQYKNPDDRRIKERIGKGVEGRGAYDVLKLTDIIEINKKYDAEDLIELLKPVEDAALIDVLNFNLLKNVSKDRIKGHPCQLPIGLLRILIKVSTNQGMWVLDPFAGTFSVSAVAAELKRNSVGIELNSEYVKMGLRRFKCEQD